MTETCCASTQRRYPKTATCPGNGKSCAGVSVRTILHHVTKPRTRRLVEQGYYFCDDPECDVVYFGEDGSVMRRDAMRAAVGQKSRAEDRAICYCFDVTWLDIQVHGEACKNFIVEKTKSSACACEIRNPSGRCCLRDFP